MTKVFIATPAYNGWLHMSYYKTVLGISHEVNTMMSLAVDALVTRARNELITRFLDKTDCTHLLFLDADVGLEAGAVTRMLLANKDVMAALIPLKEVPTKVRFPMGRIIDKKGGLLEVEHVPTGCLMLSRKAVAALCEGVPQYYKHDDPNTPYYEACRTEVGTLPGETHPRYVPEDFYMCKRLRALGFSVWVDPSIKTEHSGMFTWHFAGDAKVHMVDETRSNDEAGMSELREEAPRAGVGIDG